MKNISPGAYFRYNNILYRILEMYSQSKCIKRLVYGRLTERWQQTKLSLGWPKGDCGCLMEVELYVMNLVNDLYPVKHNIEASLRDRGGLFFCETLPCFPPPLSMFNF